jgi:hypothetical protein
MLLNANPNAEINVILDELAGDKIRATGNGNLKIGLENGEIKIDGGYTVEEGDYTFSLQSWFRKPFVIEKGSTITWDGDPLNATINIDANYIAKTVSLNDLLTNIDNSSSKISDLLVKANLSEKLAKPKIKFGISYTKDATNKDPQIENLFQLIAKNDDELNKQVAFLILFDRLLPYNSGGNTGINDAVTNTFINTMSGLLASAANKAINNLLFSRFGNNTLQANIDFRTYTPGSLVATQNTGVAERGSSTLGLKLNWFDNRLIFNINGNLDFGLISSNQSSFSLLPNLLLEYKIAPNGSMIATFFYRQSLDVLLDADKKRVSAGGGVAFRKESDTFSDLFRFRKKKKTT